MREVVLQRDGCQCLSCGKWSEFDKDITMHHVKAFGRGGETTSRNLVPLCPDCNQRLGTNEATVLYEMAGVPHRFDHGFLSDTIKVEAIRHSAELTTNLMHTRCELL